VAHTNEAGVVDLMLSNGYKIYEIFNEWQLQSHQDILFVKA
jgi:hypothetical protein